MRSLRIRRRGHRAVAAALLCLLASAAVLGGEAPGAVYHRNLYEGGRLLAQGEHAAALARFRAAWKQRPDEAEVYFWIGLVFSDMGNYGLAASNAAKATVLDETLGRAWLLWGQSLLLLRKVEEAVPKLEKAFTLEPDNAFVPYTLGLCYYYGAGDKSDAKKFFSRAQELRPHFVPARFYEACCYLDLDLPPVAIQLFREVIEADPGFVEAYFRLAFAYLRTGRYVEAERAFQEVLRRRPGHYEAHLQIAYLYLTDRPDPEQARLHLRRFCAAAPAEHPWRERVERYLASAPAPSR